MSLLKKEKKSLEKNIDDYLCWFDENFVKGQFVELYEGQTISELRNLIEKVAVWYELKYPDYKINSMIPYSNITDDNHNAFNSDLFQFENFVNALPINEQYYFGNIKYGNILYFQPEFRLAHLHLNNNGYVEMSEGALSVSKSKITDEELEGLHLNEVLERFYSENIELPKGNELESQAMKIELWNKHKKMLFDSIIYRIMERGRDIVGPRRAMLFANEFNGDMSIPMKYGITLYDSYMDSFINYYLEHGGSKELSCYVDYFVSLRDNKKTTEATIDVITSLYISSDNNNDINKEFKKVEGVN